MPAAPASVPTWPTREDLAHIRRQGFAVNEGRSERGVVAIGRPVRRADGSPAAGISISMPSVRYDPHRLRSYVATLGLAACAIEAELREAVALEPVVNGSTSRDWWAASR